MRLKVSSVWQSAQPLYQALPYGLKRFTISPLKSVPISVAILSLYFQVTSGFLPPLTEKQ